MDFRPICLLRMARLFYILSTLAIASIVTACGPQIRSKAESGILSDLNQLAVVPSAATIDLSGSQTFSVTGGMPPYVFSIVSGSGSFTGSTFNAPNTSGPVSIKITDANGSVSYATLIVSADLALTPTTLTIPVNQTHTFTVTGGQPPYTYSVPSGGGTFSAGVYTAPSSAGSATIEVTDSIGAFVTSNITIVPTLQITPASVTMTVDATQTFGATGGLAPYVYTITSGGGSFSGTTYTAAGTPETVTVQVADSLGETSSATVTIVASLVISPSTATIALGDTKTFSATGGMSPYTYSVLSGGGSFSSAVYTPASAGTVVVKVTDSLGDTSDATITVNGTLTISPTTVTLGVNDTETFTAAGGVSPYTYSVLSGSGSFSGAVYTAPSSAGSATVKVTDSLGNTANATITINAALAISPSTVTIAVNDTETFSATGGVSPYTYSVAVGGGTISGATYTAPGTAGSATVRVTDSLGNTATASVIISAALTISPTTNTMAVNDT
jgi:hypothetical protein